MPNGPQTGTGGVRLPARDRASLRLWIELLRASRAIEAELRHRLRTEFHTTLPRFDVMAALFRVPDGMLMSELSRYLMVSNGNVTGIIDRLVAEEDVERRARPGDRRAIEVRLTARGNERFEKMARAHADWLNELLGPLGAENARTFTMELRRLRTDVRGARSVDSDLRPGRAPEHSTEFPLTDELEKKARVLREEQTSTDAPPPNAAAR